MVFFSSSNNVYIIKWLYFNFYHKNLLIIEHKNQTSPHCQLTEDSSISPSFPASFFLRPERVGRMPILMREEEMEDKGGPPTQTLKYLRKLSMERKHYYGAKDKHFVYQILMFLYRFKFSLWKYMISSCYVYRHLSGSWSPCYLFYGPSQRTGLHV